MKAEQKWIEVKGKLIKINIRPEITCLNGWLGDAPETIDPLFLLMQKKIPDPSGAVAEIRTGRNKNATAGQFWSPLNPVVDQCSDSWDAGLGFKCRKDPGITLIKDIDLLQQAR